MIDTSRLERLITEEMGECCDADIVGHLARNEANAESIPDDPRTDVSVVRTLGTETRDRLVRLLAAYGELCMYEINPVTDISDRAVSHLRSDHETTPRAEAILDGLDATQR